VPSLGLLHSNQPSITGASGNPSDKSGDRGKVEFDPDVVRDFEGDDLVCLLRHHSVHAAGGDDEVSDLDGLDLLLQFLLPFLLPADHEEIHHDHHQNHGHEHGAHRVRELPVVFPGREGGGVGSS